MQMLQKRAGRQPIRTEDLDLVIGEVDRLNVLLTDLLTFHRKSTLKPLPQPILRVIQRCVQFMKPQAEESGIESQCERGDLAGSAGWIVAGSAADAITNELK